MKQRESGFTIIETSLVLAITGLVVALTLIGIGNALNQQRYTDAVNQAVDFFRGQYTQASSTVNNRPITDNCGLSGITTGPDVTRGATECILLGKILHTNSGKITVHQVVGLSDPSATTGASTMTDTQILSASQLIEGNLVDTYEPEWATSLLAPGSSNPAIFSIMIVRTPISGTVHTYSSSSATTTPSGLLSVSPQTDTMMCVDQAGFFSAMIAPMGITIAKEAVNTTGVQVVPAGDCHA